MKRKMYFVQKEGVYFHGIFWIGDDIEEAVKATDFLASCSPDNYHEWALYEFVNQTEITSCDPEHIEIYRVK